MCVCVFVYWKGKGRCENLSNVVAVVFEIAAITSRSSHVTLIDQSVTILQYGFFCPFVGYKILLAVVLDNCKVGSQLVI